MNALVAALDTLNKVTEDVPPIAAAPAPADAITMNGSTLQVPD